MSRELGELLDGLLRVFVETADAVDTATILLREGDVLRVRASVGLYEDVEANSTAKIGEGFVGRIAAERRPLQIHSASTDPLITSEAIRQRGINVLYGLPLLEGDDLIGIAHMGSVRFHDFSPEDKRLFHALANRANAAISQQLLRDAAERSLALLETVMKAAPVGLVFFDRELRYVKINDALATINGKSIDEHLGRTVAEVLPDDGAALEAALRSVLERRAPLTDVEKGAGRLLRRPAASADDEAALGIASRILRSAERMDRLIQDLLDMASIDAGRLNVVLGPCDLNSLLNEAVDAHRPLADEKDIRLELVPAESTVALGCDRERFIQALGNLIGNAIKFTPPGGHVRVRAEVAPRQATIAVEDSGPGIGADELPHVFDRYWKGRQERHGLGLGLAIVKGIVEAHGGTVTASSVAGRGSTLSLTVPR